MNINSYFTPAKGIGEGVNFLDYQLVDFDEEQWDEVPHVMSSKELIEKAKLVEYENGKVHIGRIGSGDVWNNEADRIEFLVRTYQILCEEMEGYAIGKVASNYQIPFIAIRVISNNEMLKERYDRQIGEFVQNFLLKMLQE